MRNVRRIETLLAELFMVVRDHRKDLEKTEKSIGRFARGKRKARKAIDKTDDTIKLTLIKGGKPVDDVQD